jgi:hypothetical protein
MPFEILLVLAGLAVLAGACAGVRGVRLLTRGLRGGEDPSAPLWVIRGFRGLIVAICLTSLAVGALLGIHWLVVVAALWLAEEVYETGVLALILRAGLPRRDRSETA